MVRDRHRLERRLERARRLPDEAARAALLAEIAHEVEAAEQRVERRRASAPEPRYPANLPVSERKDDLLAAIGDHQVVVVAGETGSGKSTQLPKICLELGRGVRGLIGHTQPRRLAARTVAERVAEELGTEIGGAVGYAMRFTDRVGDDTLVKVMTDGILLAEIQHDPLLARYDTLIVDEAHERSLNIDFVLGYLKRLLPRRPDLKVVVTSATIDTERFSRHFGGAPVVEVSGRTYPVELRYRPFGVAPDDDRDQVQAICDAVGELCREGPGDVLVFLSGEREIRDTAEALARAGLHDVEVLPLYARLSVADQHRVFQPHRQRRVVLATNVAETSLTVPGVRYVVDPGTARISRYSRRTKVQRLPIESVSQASANQRAGRCGRVAPGTCIRLYSEEDFAARPEFTEPEIVRTNLASVILQMAALGLGDVAAFPFVDAPDARNIADGVALLEELGALERTGTKPRLTPVGRRLAQLPLDPRLARMVVEGEGNGCVEEMLVIAAALAIHDPRERPAGKEQAAAEAHARFADHGSDFFTYLNLWRYLRDQQASLSSGQLRKLCRAEFLNYLRVREWQDVHGQLRQLARAPRAPAGGGDPPDRDAVHRSVLAGLLSHVGMRDDAKRDFQGARNGRFAVAPGSALFKKPPRWVMAAELVETNRVWARVAAPVRPEWAERLGAHLVKRSYGEPWWDARRGSAMAHERVTLYGLPIVTGRRVAYARVDPQAAREMFIRHALVEGDWETHHLFLRDNRKLVEEVRALEDRARRRDILVGDDALFGFYDARVGPEVTSAGRFEQWWKHERHRRPELLRFSLELLVDPAAGDVTAESYPEVWRQGDLALRLAYEFEPGSETDGVTVEVPLVVLNRIDVNGGDEDGFDWQVPGLRRELVTELIRSLPKQLRRNFVPAPDYAAAFLDRAGPDDGPLLPTLARELAHMTGEAVPAESWQLDRVPDHLKMTFRIVDDRGRTLALGKDLEALKLRLLPQARAAVAHAVAAVEQSGLRSWSFGELARVVVGERRGHAVTGYPALVDEGDSVAARVLATEAEQERAMWAGTRRLLLLNLPSPAKAVQRRLADETKLALTLGPDATVTELLDSCAACAVDGLVADAGGPAWDQEGFAALLSAVRVRFADTLADVVALVGRILETRRRAVARLAAMTAPALQPAVDDVRAQLSRLVHPGFVAAAGARRLPDVLRYLQAVDRRLEKLPGDPARDRELAARVQRLEQAYAELVRRRPHGAGDDLERVRWMLEELRVSYFAQALGTAEPVSEKRIVKELDRLAEGP